MATRKKTDRAAAEAWLSEPVTVRLFRDNGSYKEDKVVTVNGETVRIPRGEDVIIPRRFALVLAQGEAQDARTGALIELQAAIRSVASDLRATADAPDALAWYWLNRTVQGLDIDPAEMAALVEEVTRTDVTDIAAGVVCDCVYLLKGTEETADDE